MATTKVDAVAAKKRQQKIILIVGAVLLAGVMAIQMPKLLKHNKAAADSAAPAATSDTPSGTDSTVPTQTPTTTPVGTSVPVVVTKGGQSAQVAGVVLRTAGPPAAGASQLWSLSRFKVKDPFVQQVDDGTGAATGGKAATATPGGPKVTTSGGSTTTGTGTSTGTGTVATPTTSTPVAYAYATLMVNGKAQQLTLKQVFPKGQPTFVLQAVGKNFVKIGVAGGKFTGGAAVKLDRGEKVTLMNTATGQRFVMKLVYTGDQPEQIAGFKAGATTSPAAPAVATQTTQTTNATAGAPSGTSY